jgi:hypothetical protein
MKVTNFNRRDLARKVFKRQTIWQQVKGARGEKCERSTEAVVQAPLGKG